MKDIPALSVDERHMMIMSNLEILVKLSKNLMAKSVSVLHKTLNRNSIKATDGVQLQDQMSNIQRTRDFPYSREKGGDALYNVNKYRSRQSIFEYLRQRIWRYSLIIQEERIES